MGDSGYSATVQTQLQTLSPPLEDGNDSCVSEVVQEAFYTIRCCQIGLPSTHKC